MKLRIHHGLAVLATLSSLHASADPFHATTVIDLENIGVPNQIVANLPSYASQMDGYTLQVGTVRDLAATSPWAANGPAYSGNYAGWASNTSVYREDGGLFSARTIALKSVSGDATVNFAGFLNFQSAGAQFDVAVTSTAWTVVTIDYAKIDTLSILALDGATVMFDDITVTAVPEPSTYAMFFAGLGLLGVAARRKHGSA